MPTVLRTRALTTIVNFREYLSGSTSGGGKDDNYWERLINRSTEFIERYTRRQLKAQSYTEYYDGDGSSGEVFLNQWPINSVTSIHDDPDRNFTSTYLIAVADYVIYADQGRVQLRNNRTAFYKGEQNIKAVYSGGYDSANTDHLYILDGLDFACCVIAAMFYQESPGGEGLLMKSGKRLDDGSVDGLIKTLPPYTKDLLSSLRRTYR